MVYRRDAAGLVPAGVICEILNPDGTMARLPELHRVAVEHGLRIISIADLIRYRRKEEILVSRVAEATIPTPHGDNHGVWINPDDPDVFIECNGQPFFARTNGLRPSALDVQ